MNHHSTLRAQRIPILGLGAGLLLAALATFALAGAVSSAGPGALSKGPIPAAAADGRGGLDISQIPAFVPVWDRDGVTIAGYVPKGLLFAVDAASDKRPVAPTIPVFGEDLTTIVGHMVPDKGFVPEGVDPNTLPTIQSVGSTK